MSIIQPDGRVWCPRGKHILSRDEFGEDATSSNGLSAYCKKCHAASANSYYHDNSDSCKEKMRQRNREQRERCLQHYGNKCACCGETRYEFLAIDHVNGGGGKHREEIGRGGHIYRWLIKNSFPAEFRVLCHNCNQAIGLYGYCPHEREQVDVESTQGEVAQMPVA